MPARYRYVSGEAKAKRAAARQTDDGRMARRFYNARPEVRQKAAIRRQMKKHMAGK